MEDAEGPVSLNSSQHSPPSPDDTMINVPTPPEEMSASTSRKRSSEEVEQDDVAQETQVKRRRLEEAEDTRSLPSPPPEELGSAVLDESPSFDDEPALLLRQSIIVMLQHIGFEGATRSALEELCGEVESYAMRFLSLVTAAMRTARRTLPTPLDFEYAFRHEGLTARLLEPHLKPPVTPPTIRREANQVAAEVHVYQPSSKLIGDDLSGDSEKRSRAYIPKQFPSFPSKHTYKFTEVKTERETDPRKIREKATEEARHGEEALRRLVKVGKDHAGVHHDGNTLTGRHLRDQLWEDALRDLTLSAVQSKVSATKDGDEEQSVFVNAAKRYGRKSAVRSRKV